MPFQGVVQGGRVIQRAGRYRHRVQLVKPTLVQNGAGGWDIRSNTVVATLWASIEALTAMEKFAAHEFASSVTHKIWIRHPRSLIDPTGNTSGVTANMQIWYGTRQFQISAVLNPDERPDALLLMATEINDSVQQLTASPPESAL